MTPAEAREMYRTQFDLHGEDIVIRRYAGTGVDRPHADYPCRARVMGYAPDELVGGVTQGDRHIVALAEDLEGYSPPFTIAKGDKAIVRDVELAIMGVNDSTRRIGSVLIAYDLQVRG